MTRLKAATFLAAALLLAGCGGSTEPTQPKLSDAELKAVMEKAKQQSLKERGNRRPGQ